MSATTSASIILNNTYDLYMDMQAMRDTAAQALEIEDGEYTADSVQQAIDDLAYELEAYVLGQYRADVHAVSDALQAAGLDHLTVDVRWQGDMTEDEINDVDWGEIAREEIEEYITENSAASA